MNLQARLAKQEAWLATHDTKRCQALHASITQEQCDSLRHRPRAGSLINPEIVRPPCCDWCLGLGRGLKPRPKPAPRPEPKLIPAPKLKPAPGPEPKPKPRPEPKPKLKPKAKPAPKPKAKPGPKPQEIKPGYQFGYDKARLAQALERIAVRLKEKEWVGVRLLQKRYEACFRPVVRKLKKVNQRRAWSRSRGADRDAFIKFVRSCGLIVDKRRVVPGLVLDRKAWAFVEKHKDKAA